MPRHKKHQAPPKQVSPTELLPKVEPTPKQVMHAPSIDPSKDFTGWDWRSMPYWVLKAAPHNAATSKKIIGRTECIECKRKIWHCDPREDTCEECQYLLYQRNRDLQATRRRARGGILVNPFRDV